jgi:hypothetical protein
VQLLLALPEPHAEHVLDADGDEAGLDLTGGRAREVRLPAPGRAVQEESSARLLAVHREELRLRQRVDDLHPDLVLDLLHAADVSEAHLRALEHLADRSVCGLVLVREAFGARLPVGAESYLLGHGDSEAVGELGVAEVGVRGDRVRVPLPRLLDLPALVEDERDHQVGPRRTRGVLEQALVEHERLVERSGRARVHALLVEDARESEPRAGTAAPAERFLIVPARGVVVGDGQVRLSELESERHVVGQRLDGLREARQLVGASLVHRRRGYGDGGALAFGGMRCELASSPSR